MRIRKYGIMVWAILALFYYLILYKLLNKLCIDHNTAYVKKLLDTDLDIYCNPESSPEEMAEWINLIKKEPISKNETDKRIAQIEKEMEELCKKHNEAVKEYTYKIGNITNEIKKLESNINIQEQNLIAIQKENHNLNEANNKLGKDIANHKRRSVEYIGKNLTLDTDLSKFVLNCITYSKSTLCKEETTQVNIEFNHQDDISCYQDHLFQY